jgi:hypothetical protein
MNRDVHFDRDPSPTENKVMRIMICAGCDVDVNIDEIFEDLYPNVAPMAAKTRQQYVGSFVSRLNGKMFGHRIVPGDLKRTYRLIKVLL